MGLRGGTGPWGQYKTPGVLGFIRAQRGRARSALFSRVFCYKLIDAFLWDLGLIVKQEAKESSACPDNLFYGKLHIVLHCFIVRL